MTTKRILELTELDEPISPYCFGPNASIQRGRRSRGPLRLHVPTLEEERLERRDQPSMTEIMMVRRLKGRVI